MLDYDIQIVGGRIGKEPAQKPGRSKQDYSTPVSFLAAVEKRFGPIDFDLSAHSGNNVAARYYSPDDDSLKQDWTLPGVRVAWLNPPFADIEPWAARCYECRALPRWTLLLVPASIGANWFYEHVVRAAMVFGLNPRLSFDGKNPYPKDCLLACFGFNACGFDVWRWR